MIDIAREGRAAPEPVLEPGADVAHPLEVLPDVVAADRLVVAGQRARRPGRPARPDRLDGRLGCKHAGAHGVVDPLESRHVDEARAVAGDHRARHVEAVREREVAALRNRLGAPRDPAPAAEDLVDLRVRLQLLEKPVHRERRVGVVEPDDHAERDAVLAHRVDERAAELAPVRRAAQRPAHRVDDAVERLLDLPDLLDAERPHLRLRLQAEAVERDAGEMSLRPLGEDRHTRLDVRAGLEVRELLAVPAAALVARPDADDATGLHEQVGRGRLRDDDDAEFFGALGQPAAHLIDGADVIPVVPHRRRRWDADRRAPRQVVDALALHRSDEGKVARRRAGEELAEGVRVDDRAREEVRAGRLALVEDGDRHVAEPLGELGPSSSSWPARTAAARPAGPPPTIRIPTSIRSSAGSVGSRTNSAGSNGGGKSAGRTGGADYPRRSRTSSVSFGMISCRSPTTARSAYSKIGAFASLLIATIVPEFCIPTLCWIAPEIPQAR